MYVIDNQSLSEPIGSRLSPCESPYKHIGDKKIRLRVKGESAGQLRNNHDFNPSNSRGLKMRAGLNHFITLAVKKWMDQPINSAAHSPLDIFGNL